MTEKQKPREQQFQEKRIQIQQAKKALEHWQRQKKLITSHQEYLLNQKETIEKDMLPKLKLDLEKVNDAIESVEKTIKQLQEKQTKEMIK